MNKRINFTIGDEEYDVLLSLQYNPRTEGWVIDIDEPSGITPAQRAQITQWAFEELDFHELQMEWEYDQEERMACDRYHSDRDEW